MRWLIWAMVRWRLRSRKAWITAVPRAVEVMKSGSPVKAWMRLAGEATIGGAVAAEADRACSGLADSGLTESLTRFRHSSHTSKKRPLVRLSNKRPIIAIDR